MTRQGYLILHEKRQRPKIFYFSLEDGFFRYYASAQCAKCLGEFKLSGCKIVVKVQKRHDGMPHSFFLETRKVFVKDRSYTLGNPSRVELSATDNDDRQEWGKALFSWQRYYWRDPRAQDESDAVVDDGESVKDQLEQLIDRYYAKAATTGYSISFASAKQPLSFIRRNAYSLRRSLSFSMMSAASTPSTSSSSGSSSSNTTDSSNQQSHSTSNNSCKTQNAEFTDCEKDKVVLAKVAFPESRLSEYSAPYRGNNQESH
ncbi:Pleckstrin homology-like domain, partial [Globisporangium splendens]